MEKLKIVYRKINDLTPYDNNPRLNDAAVDAVAKSIEEFGFKVPIVIDKDGVIVAGHTRLKAAKQLQIDEVPCIIADDLSDEELKAFRLADNKVSELAEWDFTKLEEELEQLQNLDIDMEDFGFQNLSSEELQDNQVVSGELDISDFEDTFEVKLKFNYDDYHKVISFLREYDNDLSKAFLKVMADND